MTYIVTPKEMESITAIEIAFGTDRLLPAFDDIPDDFFQGNIYTRIADSIFYNNTLPACSIKLLHGVTAQNLNKVVRAHLISCRPKHEHKIAGVGFLISKNMIVTDS